MRNFLIKNAKFSKIFYFFFHFFYDRLCGVVGSLLDGAEENFISLGTQDTRLSLSKFIPKFE